MAGMRAELDVLAGCASVLTGEAGGAAASAEVLGQLPVAEGTAGRTPASAALVAAVTAAAAHWSAELGAGARALTATGLALDQAELALRSADRGFAGSLGGQAG